MATQIDELSIKFSAEMSGFKSQLDKVESSVAKTAKGVEVNAGRMSKAFASVGKYLAFGALAGGLMALVRMESALEASADQLQDAAQRANIHEEALQRLQIVARENGSSLETMNDALVRLQKSLGAARSGSTQLKEIFSALGLSRLVTENVSTEESFYALADAISNVKDEALRAKILNDLLGRSGDELGDLMAGGAVGVMALTDAIGENRIRSKELNDKLAESYDKTQAFYEIVSTLGSFLAGVFVDVVKEMASWINAAIELWDSWYQSIKSVVDLISTANWSMVPVDSQSAPQNEFVRGGRGMLEPELYRVAAPTFAAPAGSPYFSGVKRNKLSTLKGGEGAARSAKLDDAKRATEQYERAIADLRLELQNLALDEAEASYQQDLANALARAGVTLDSERGAQIAELVAQIQQLTEAQAALAAADAANAEAGKKWLELRQQAGDSIAGAFERAIVEGENLRQVFAGLLQDLARLIFQKLVFNALSDSISEGLGIVGGFASGGGVNPNNAYMVGERGPEMFVPKVPGNIIPRRGLGGVGTFTYAPTVNAPGNDAAAIQRMLARERQETMKLIPRIMVDRQRRNKLAGAFAS